MSDINNLDQAQLKALFRGLEVTTFSKAYYIVYSDYPDKNSFQRLLGLEGIEDSDVEYILRHYAKYLKENKLRKHQLQHLVPQM